MPRNMTFAIRGEYITLDALLKAVVVADSGAQAKHRIAEGEVTVDGVVETRKTRKLRGGETVVVDDLAVVLVAESAA